MFISEFSGDINFDQASFTILAYSTINYITKMEHFTIRDGDRLIGFEKINRRFKNGVNEKTVLKLVAK